MALGGQFFGPRIVATDDATAARANTLTGRLDGRRKIGSHSRQRPPTVSPELYAGTGCSTLGLRRKAGVERRGHGVKSHEQLS